jgi:hypothetical protein
MNTVIESNIPECKQTLADCRPRTAPAVIFRDCKPDDTEERFSATSAEGALIVRRIFWEAE